MSELSFTRVTHNIDIADDARERVPSRFRQSDNYCSFVAAMGEATQTFEDLAFNVLVSTTIENAEGRSLDQWGELIGVSRDGFADSRYRRFIRAGILIRLSTGRRTEIPQIYQLLMEAPTVKWYQHSPKAFQLEAFRGSYISDAVRRKVKRLMDRVKPAGKKMTLVEVLTPPSDSSTGFEVARTL